MGQWSSIQKSGPPQQNTDPDAKPIPSQYNCMWCDSLTTSQYVLIENQMWKYELKDNRWLWQPDLPQEFEKRTKASYWQVQGYYYVFGGQGIQDNNVWMYDTISRSLTKLKTINSPGICYENMFWESETKNNLYLYGGYCNNTSNNNVYTYNLETNTWSVTSSYMGGVGASVHVNDVVYIYNNDQMTEFDLTTNEWSSAPNISPPPGLNRTGMILWKAVASDSIYLFGGIAGGKIYQDTWSYSPATKLWTFVKNEGPSPRYGMTYCVNNNNYLYMFGGSNTNDMWQYGPYTVQNVIDRIEWKLDSATLMATWGVALTSSVLLILLIIVLYGCVKRCTNRKNKHVMPINGGNNKTYVIGDDDF
jgi:N-acetylneuraminic acid mutarotase